MKHYVQLAAIIGHVNCHYVQLAAIRGTPYRGNDYDAEILLDDFYTMVMKDSEGNKGIRKVISNENNVTNMSTFSFVTEEEQSNFINFCKTDFARFCLCLLKNAQIIVSGELEIVPYLDFTQEWNDEKLFKHFDIKEELQEYIRNYIPDFHKIRNK